ncbi:unnamed protein product [Ranitomeya imitator]|uniref:Uncharacterized protein n=1 Tax=Ranitomeya imitator TaxID=111125 RepID=A0ABN9MET3_9NEOB|nr:unnamed protein product [Ranitomeya imitator]
MQELGMHSYLAVGRGSQNESLMSIIEYKGSSCTRYPSDRFSGRYFPSSLLIGMDEMKYDMCGACLCVRWGDAYAGRVDFTLINRDWRASGLLLVKICLAAMLIARVMCSPLCRVKLLKC